MIFITVGISSIQFNRLIKTVDLILKKFSVNPEDVFFQTGSSIHYPESGLFEPYISFAEMEDRIRKADIVICHAGVGTILLSLLNRKKPIVIPRRKKYGELVDDHQLKFTRQLASEGLITYPLNNQELEAIIRRYLSSPAAGESLFVPRPSREDLLRYLSSLLNRDSMF
jgi:UDP-N-acetylglucosamine transferase subunit ALG13